MIHTEFPFRAQVWLYPGDSSWHFVTVPPDISVEISERFADRKRGWGSLRVAVTIGATTWKTSIFPDKKIGAYLLPIKADVRKKEMIKAGSKVKVILEILP